MFARSMNFARMAARPALLATATVGLGMGYTLQAADAKALDLPGVKKAVAKALEDDMDMGPTLVRLAWHASGTYDKHSKTGGSDGATMRFAGKGEGERQRPALRRRPPCVVFNFRPKLSAQSGLAGSEGCGGAGQALLRSCVRARQRAH